MTSPDLSRFGDWLSWLARQGRAGPRCPVIWVGGSAATGGYDDWSDLDVELLCTPGEHDAVYDRLLERVRADFDVDHIWELPQASWPDGRQCFVNHQHRPGALEEPTRIVDLHISSISDAHRIVDVRRQRPPLVVHDHDGLVELRRDDEAEIRGRPARSGPSRSGSAGPPRSGWSTAPYGGTSRPRRSPSTCRSRSAA